MIRQRVWRRVIPALVVAAGWAAWGASWVGAAAVVENRGRVRVRTEVTADSVTVGERFHVRHEFLYPDSLTLLEPLRTAPGTCRIVSLRWSREDKDDSTERAADFTLITLDLDEARFPAIPVDFLTPAGDTLRTHTDDVAIPVRRLTTAGAEARPLKAQWVAPVSRWKWFIAAAALLLATGFLWWWLRRRSRRPVAAAPEPRLPPDYVALTELTRIEKLDLLRAGEFKRFYSLVTDAVRRYLEDRFGVEAIDRTTAELVGGLASRGRRVDKLEDLLREADLVKFAKYRPGRATGENAMTTAREIVVKTRERVAPDPPGPGKPETAKERTGS